MYAKIKELADEALKLQNKDAMNIALHNIKIICEGILAVAADPKGGSYVDYKTGETVSFPKPVALLEEAVVGMPVSHSVLRDADHPFATSAVAEMPLPVKAKKGGAK